MKQINTPSKRIEEDVETARRVVLVLANDILRQAKKYVKAAENVNTDDIEFTDESYIDRLEKATVNLVEAIKTGQMFNEYKK